MNIDKALHVFISFPLTETMKCLALLLLFVVTQAQNIFIDCSKPFQKPIQVQSSGAVHIGGSSHILGDLSCFFTLEGMRSGNSGLVIDVSGDNQKMGIIVSSNRISIRSDERNDFVDVTFSQLAWIELRVGPNTQTVDVLALHFVAEGKLLLLKT